MKEYLEQLAKPLQQYTKSGRIESSYGFMNTHKYNKLESR